MRSAAVFSIVLLSQFCPLSASGEARMNVIFLDLCSTRADHFSSYGYPVKTTPHMDALAGEGALFENALSEGSWCLPSYASLLTGHVPEVHGLYTNIPRGLPRFEATLASELKTAGYRTALFSGGVYLLPDWGLTKGFDSYLNIFSTSSPSTIPAPFEDNLDAIVDWLKTRDDQPFFLFATIDDLHVPYHSEDPDKYDRGYTGVANEPDVYSVPFARAYNGEPGGYADRFKALAAEFKSDPRNLKHFVARYDAALNHVDSRVGEFLAKLREMGLEKNTIFILSADHGEMLGEHGLLNHTQGLYEPVLRVPLMIRHPGLQGLAGRRVTQQIQRIDLMPTILDIAGVNSPGLELQGRSFLPLLKDQGAPWREYAFARNKRNLAKASDFYIEERIVRGGCWKLHHYLYRAGYELYDICKDPLETKDLAQKRPEIVSKLSFELLRNVELSRPHQPGLPSGKGPDTPLLAPPAAPK